MYRLKLNAWRRLMLLCARKVARSIGAVAEQT